MKILLTNDDGITAPGIAALFWAIRSLGEVVVIAPAGVQSAMSHGITFHRPLLTRAVQVNEDMRGIAVEGTPADCVKLGLRTIVKHGGFLRIATLFHLLFLTRCIGYTGLPGSTYVNLPIYHLLVKRAILWILIRRGNCMLD